jgi:hypothetical protein
MNPEKRKRQPTNQPCSALPDKLGSIALPQTALSLIAVPPSLHVPNKLSLLQPNILPLLFAHIIDDSASV